MSVSWCRLWLLAGCRGSLTTAARTRQPNFPSEDTPMTVPRTLALLALTGLLTTSARADSPSPADLVEGRVPSPLALGNRKREVGVEMAAPQAMPSVVKAKDGRW